MGNFGNCSVGLRRVCPSEARAFAALAVRKLEPESKNPIGGELITVGSDGPRPKEAGGAFLQAEELLKKCGFRYYTVDHKQKPVFYKI